MNKVAFIDQRILC